MMIQIMDFVHYLVYQSKKLTQSLGNWISKHPQAK